MSELPSPSDFTPEPIMEVSEPVPSKWSRILATGITAIAVLGAPIANEQPSRAETSQAVIGMPFSGKWGFNAIVNPPFTDDNSSHPKVHNAYGFDWSTDLYASAGTEVKVYGTSSHGIVTFRRSGISDTCSSYGANVAGKGITFDVLINSGKVGEVKYDHLDLIDVGSAPIASGTTVGEITSEPLNSSCFPDST